MEELKMLVDMVAHLPNLAVWALVAYLVYKVAVIGSIYGLIRFAIEKLHSWLTKPKHELKEVEVRAMLDGIAIRSSVDYLIAQVRRIEGVVSVGGGYIHQRDVDWLRDAISEKLELQKKEAK